MDNNEITITQALNQVQSWINAKEYDLAIQGCQEILELEPGNKRALSLMKLSEEARYKEQGNDLKEPSVPVPKPVPKPKSEPVQIPKPEPKPAPQPEPLAKPAPIPEPAPTSKIVLVEEAPELLHKPSEVLKSASDEKRKYFLAMLIPALLVVIIGGGIIWALSIKQRKNIIDEAVNSTTSQDAAYLVRNEKRQEDLSKIGLIIETYQEKNGAFPSVSQVEDVILADEEFSEIPLDPKHAEFDENEELFAYIYAVYDSPDGNNSEYVISALFEDSQGKGYEWTRGANIIEHSDYRDISKKNVHILENKKEPTTPSGPKVKVRRN